MVVDDVIKVRDKTNSRILEARAQAVAGAHILQINIHPINSVENDYNVLATAGTHIRIYFLQRGLKNHFAPTGCASLTFNNCKK